MADRIVAVGLTAEVASYISNMNKASAAAAKTAGATEKIGSSVDKTAKSMLTMKNIMLYTFGYGLATIATRAIGNVVRGMMDFEDAMANLGAASMATEGELKKMREAALQAGQDTVFTATDAADAMTELSKAGVSTSDILGGALAGALDLAAAGQVDVAFAAETAATAMVQFNLSGSQMSHVADLLAAGAGKAQGGVEDLALALRQGGQVASMVGWSFEDTTTALTAFAAAGLLGSDAGTSLKTMLLRLARPSNQAAEVMERYGLSVYDASGNMVGAAELAGRLTAAFADLDPQARNAALGILFGTDAVRAANVLFSNGQAGIQKWSDAVNDAGYAAEVAARKNDTLRGDLNKLSGTFSAIINGSGGGFIELLRGIAQAADEALKDAEGTIEDINSLIDETLNKWHYKDQPVLGDDPAGAGGLGVFFKDFTSQVSEAIDTILLLPTRLNQELYPSLYAGEQAMTVWGERLTAAAAAHEQMAGSADASADSVEGVSGAAGAAAEGIDSITQSAEEAQAEIDELKESIEAFGQEAIDKSRAHDQLTEAIRDARQPFRDLRDAQRELANATTDSERAAARQKVAAAQAAISVKGNSDAALANRESLRRLAEQGNETAAAFIDGTARGAKKARAETLRARDAFIATAIQMGYTKTEARRLADQYGLIPGKVPTEIVLTGAEGAIAQAARVQAALLGIKDRYVNVFVNEVRRDAAAASRGSQQPGGGYRGGWASDIAGYAGGGFVQGPGSSTSDSVLARLSRGEFVVNARAASDYGPLLEAINKGMKPPVGGAGVTVNLNGTTEQVAQQVVQRVRYEQALAGAVI